RRRPRRPAAPGRASGSARSGRRRRPRGTGRGRSGGSSSRRGRRGRCPRGSAGFGAGRRGRRQGGRRAGRGSWRPRSRLFFRQVGGVGLGADLEDEVADAELGAAEDVAVVGGGEGACDLEDLVLGGLPDGLGQLLGAGLLLGGEGAGRHGRPPWLGDGFSRDASVSPFVYKKFPNFRHASSPSFLPAELLRILRFLRIVWKLFGVRVA